MELHRDELVIVGLSHRTAPLHVREKLAFDETTCRSLLASHTGYEGAVLLSTCNRVELYGASDNPRSDRGSLSAQLISQLALHAQVEVEELRPHLYVYQGDEALTHLFRVASSLDSMVVGEPQILGQLKSALELSREVGSAGSISSLMDRAFLVARRIRSQTGIGKSVVSISSVAVHLAAQIFEDLSQRTTLLVGAGEMGALAARHLSQHGVGRLLVANRSLQRATEVAEELNGHPRELSELPSLLSQADIVITSTGSREPIITKKLVTTALKVRKYKPIFFIDIAVPRDVDPEVNQLDNVYVYDVDDLSQIANENRAQREREAREAEQLIGQEVLRFHRERAQRELGPLIHAVRQKVHALKQAEMTWAQAKAKDLSEEQLHLLERFADRLTNKFLHEVLIGMKQLAASPDQGVMLDVVSTLFGLDEKATQEVTTYHQPSSLNEEERSASTYEERGET